MTRVIIAAGIFLIVTSVLVGYHSAAAAQNSRVQELEDENAALKRKVR